MMSEECNPMTDDLVERLRSRNGNAAGFGIGPVCDEAADALAAKDAEIATLRSELKALECGPLKVELDGLLQSYGQLSARNVQLQAENGQLRELMNCYNLGGWTDSFALIQERDAALAGKPERKAQDDGGYDLVAAWDRSGLVYADGTVDPVFQAGWDAAMGTT